MAHPKAYSPEQGYQYQILTRNTSYDRSYEHLDYAKDKADKNHLLKEYRLAYMGMGFEFKVISLPKKYHKVD